MKSNLVRKFTSRKFWVSVGSFVGMMVVATGGSESEAAQVTALIMAGASVLAYIIGEGLVDGANKEIGEIGDIGESIQLEQIVEVEDEE